MDLEGFGWRVGCRGWCECVEVGLQSLVEQRVGWAKESVA